MALKVLTPCPLIRTSATRAQCLPLQLPPLLGAASKACHQPTHRRHNPMTTPGAIVRSHCRAHTRQQTPALKTVRSMDKVVTSRARWAHHHQVDLQSQVSLVSQTRSQQTVTQAKVMITGARVAPTKKRITNTKQSTRTTGALTTVEIHSTTTAPSPFLPCSLSTLTCLPIWGGPQATKAHQAAPPQGAPHRQRHTTSLATAHLLVVRNSPVCTTWSTTEAQPMVAREVICTGLKPT